MKNKQFINLYNLLLLVGFFTVFVSCEQADSIIGLNITPGSDKMDLFRDTINVQAVTVTDSDISTDERTLATLGSFNDPIFGFTKASFLCHTRISSNNVDFSSVDNINSLELHLRYYSHYGDSTAAQSVSVYRLLNDVFFDSSYNADYKPDMADLELLSTTNLEFNDADSLLTITLPQTLAESFVNSANISHFVDNDTFIEFFKGLYITTDDLGMGGCIFSVNILDDNSRMMLYFNDTSEYEFLINTKSATVNMFEHDYTNASAEIQTVLADTTGIYDFCYIQSLGGFKTKLSFPELETMFDSSNIAINKAQLTIQIETGNGEDTYAPPPKLAMVAILESGQYDFVTDYKVNNASFGGELSSTEYTYVFNIPFHIQELVNGNTDYGLYLFATDNRTKPYRTVINGNIDSDKRMKLEIYYSKY